MKLTLRIENLDSLPDGGPLEFSAVSRGFEVGRDSAMDWTLPDTNRHISSRHFEVTFRDGQFWLNDISTNGTFVYGASMRVSSPFALTHNERLQVGQYIIRVLVVDQAGGHVAAPLAAPASDPWSLGPSPSPMPQFSNTPLPAPSRPSSALAGQFGDSFVENPRPAALVPTTPPHDLPIAPPANPLPTVNAPTAPPASTAPPAPPLPTSEPFPSKPVPVAIETPADALPLLDAICKGAGLPAGSLSKVDVTQLGEDIGKCLRIATEQMMALLGARAAAKQFVKSSSRTMIGGINNSPLKFKPNATEALTTMFAPKTESYLGAVAAFSQGFDDVKRHQTAVYAAMQPALARLLEDLSPESIEERSTGGIMTSKKARAWELFVERWDAKTHPYENGMLDVFLAYFSDAYDEAVKSATPKKGG
ncbi:MAG: type secretion system-associated domain protein TagH [Cypionkella sp.]|uniref:type VI secretion system-associated FHA domain protein TagH n=1 Tax=Cypionkella sp. TaxID=2811411 RepID=UPI0026154F52|nr:type VI secretion system-associated FHA domain protein TagH [Cypionkella sp.]MDB5659883.1 type secretion system-associated domain protein TagH [Cypionkella sp.]